AQYDFIEAGIRNNLTYDQILTKIMNDPKLKEQFKDIHYQVDLIEFMGILEMRMENYFEKLTDKAQELRKIADDVKFIVDVVEKAPISGADISEIVDYDQGLSLNLTVKDPVKDEFYDINVSSEGLTAYESETKVQEEETQKSRDPPSGGTIGYEDSSKVKKGESEGENVGGSGKQYSVTRTHESTEYFYDEDGLLNGATGRVKTKSYNYAVYKTYGVKSFNPNAENALPKMELCEVGEAYMTSLTFVEKTYAIINGMAKSIRETKSSYGFNTSYRSRIDNNGKVDQKNGSDKVIADRGYSETVESTVYEYDSLGNLTGAKGKILKMNNYKMIGTILKLFTQMDEENSDENYIKYEIINGEAKEVERSQPSLKIGDNAFDGIATEFNQFLQEYIGVLTAEEQRIFDIQLEQWFDFLGIPMEDRVALRTKIKKMLAKGSTEGLIDALVETSCPWATYTVNTEDFVNMYQEIFAAYEYALANGGNLPEGFKKKLEQMLSKIGIEIPEQMADKIIASIKDAVEEGNIDILINKLNKFEGIKASSFGPELAGKTLCEWIVFFAKNKDNPEVMNGKEIEALKKALGEQRTKALAEFSSATMGSSPHAGQGPPLIDENFIEYISNLSITEFANYLQDFYVFTAEYTVVTQDSQQGTTSKTYSHSVNMFGTKEIKTSGMLLQHLKEVYEAVRDVICGERGDLTDEEIEEMLTKLRVPYNKWDEFKEDIRLAIKKRNLSWLETDSVLGWNQFLPKDSSGANASDIVGFKYLGKDPITGKDIYLVRYKTNDFASALLKDYTKMENGKIVLDTFSGRGGDSQVQKTYTFYDSEGNVVGKTETTTTKTLVFAPGNEDAIKSVKPYFNKQTSKTENKYIMIGGEAVIQSTTSSTSVIPMYPADTKAMSISVSTQSYEYRKDEEGKAVLIGAKGGSFSKTTADEGTVIYNQVKNEYAIMYGKAVITKQLTNTLKQRATDDPETGADETNWTLEQKITVMEYDEGGRLSKQKTDTYECNTTQGAYQDTIDSVLDKGIFEDEMSTANGILDGLYHDQVPTNSTEKYGEEARDVHKGEENFVIINGEAKLESSWNKDYYYTKRIGLSRVYYKNKNKVNNTYDENGELETNTVYSKTWSQSQRLDSSIDASGEAKGVAAKIDPSWEVKNVVKDKYGRILSETGEKHESTGETVWEADFWDLTLWAKIGRVVKYIVKIITAIVATVVGRIVSAFATEAAGRLVGAAINAAGSILADILENLCAHGVDSDYWGADFWLRVIATAIITFVVSLIMGEILGAAGGGGAASGIASGIMGAIAGNLVGEIITGIISSVISNVIVQAIVSLAIYVVIKVAIDLFVDLLIDFIKKELREWIKDMYRDENGHLSKEDQQTVAAIMIVVDIVITVASIVVGALLEGLAAGFAGKGAVKLPTMTADGKVVKKIDIGETLKKNLKERFSKELAKSIAYQVAINIIVGVLQFSISNQIYKKEMLIRSKYKKLMKKQKLKNRRKY
ncbi:hypothetical protein BVX93_01315, partial [bacterium B13(2017)]